MSNKFTFCPNCKSPSIEYKDTRKWFCKDCGFDLYNNVATAVGLIIQDIDGSVIFEVRAKEPRKGFLALPGGFCDQDETAEESALRECKEETGIVPDKIKYIASFPNTYPYKNFIYKTCDLFFLAEFSNSNTKIIDKMQGQESEVENFKSIKINSIEEIDNIPTAFDSAKKALRVWFNNKNQFK